jgi:hypothetical protein
MKVLQLLAGSLLLIGALGGVAAREIALVGVHQGYSPEQPIAFSHQLHAGEAKVPCLYCHSGAAHSRHAGIPAASVCMNCHGLLTKETPEIRKLKEALEQRRPIGWIKVHNLPDFVYFNHSQHVGAAVACRECHGPVETMATVRQHAPLTMGWCLDCHRQRRVGAGVAVAARTAPQHPLAGLDCGKCHY